jgi:putative sugar O-methyltransferase
MDNLLNETFDYYQKVDSIYKTTGYRDSYELNAFWSRENMQNMMNMLHNSQSAVDAIHSVQKTWMFSVNTSDFVKSKAVNWLINEQKQRNIDVLSMPSSIAESDFSNPDNNVVISGRKLTPDFLRTVNITYEIKKYCQIDKPKPNIVELGGGCGHLARTIRFFIPNCSYVIVDIPESLCFSYMFLKLNFPEAKSIYITDEKQLEGFWVNNFDYVFIPTKFAEGILGNNFDIFINTASLGEMKNSVIRYWMDFVQNKLKVEYLFTLNRYLNTIKTDGSMEWRLDENECSVLYDSNWDMLNWELEPSFTRCPYVDTIIARYLEIAARRIPAVSPEERQKKAQQLISEVMDEDWVRLEKTINQVMTYRDNILVNDLSMNGTLFKLWESIRLCPNEINVSLMLKYLETLNRRQRVEFEETYYYENLFKKLFVNRENEELYKIYKIIEEKRLYGKSFPGLKPDFSQADFEWPLIPELIYEGYNGFNLVRYKNKFYALRQVLGGLDLSKLGEDELAKYQISGMCIIKNSFNEAKLAVAEMACKYNSKTKTVNTLKSKLDKPNIREYKGCEDYQLKYRDLVEDFKTQSDYLDNVLSKLSDIQSSSILKLVMQRLKNKINGRK